MTRFAAVWFLVFLASCMVGCSAGSTEPTLDCSSQEAYDASIDAMSAGMSMSDQDRLAQALISLAFKMPAVTVENPTNADVFKPLHGLTAQQIIDKAELAD